MHIHTYYIDYVHIPMAWDDRRIYWWPLGHWTRRPCLSCLRHPCAVHPCAVGRPRNVMERSTMFSWENSRHKSMVDLSSS